MHRPVNSPRVIRAMSCGVIPPPTGSIASVLPVIEVAAVGNELSGPVEVWGDSVVFPKTTRI